MKNLLNLFTPLGDETTRNQILSWVIQPLGKKLDIEGAEPRKGAILLVSLVAKDVTCQTMQFQFGLISPKNTYFAAEKIARLSLEQPRHTFASESADPERKEYGDLPWEELKKFKFAGALRIKHGEGEILLSVSGLPPQADEVLAFLFAERFLSSTHNLPPSRLLNQELLAFGRECMNRMFPK